MNCIYKNEEHFLSETKIQAKFFDNLSLNAYRKAIANRYGYKGVDLFKKSLSKIKIYVVGYENLGSSGGNDWFYDKNDAVAWYEQERLENLKHGIQTSFYEFEIDKNSDVDDYLINHDSELFDASEKMFPYPKEIWSKVAEKHNNNEESEMLLTKDQIKNLVIFTIRLELLQSAKNIHINEKSDESKESLDNCKGEYLDSLSELVGIDARIIDNVAKQIDENYKEIFKGSILFDKAVPNSPRDHLIEILTNNINSKGVVVTFGQVKHWVGSDAGMLDIKEHIYGSEECEPMTHKDADDIISMYKDSI
jgi:hypothetical protein